MITHANDRKSAWAIDDAIRDGWGPLHRLSMQLDRISFVLSVVRRHGSRYPIGVRQVREIVLAEYDKFSERTIRRDLIFLEFRGLVESSRLPHAGRFTAIKWKYIGAEPLIDGLARPPRRVSE